MFPYQLTKCKLLTDAFGVSRVHETIRYLKEGDTFLQNEQVTINDVAVVVYCLACCDTVKQTKEFSERYLALQSSDSMPLSEIFALVIIDVSFLSRLQEVYYFKESGSVILSFLNEGKLDPVYYSTGEEISVDTEVSTTTSIKQSWWVKLKEYASKANLELAVSSQVN